MANSLKDQLEKAKGNKIPPPQPDKQQKTQITNKEPPITKSTREGKKGISLWYDPIVLKQLKQLALDTDKTQTALITEAINDLFSKYGKPPIA